MIDQSAPTTAAPAPSRATKLAYGFGAVSNGVTDTGFNYFLLIFYSQVIGLDPRLVSLAITISLFVDAFADPVLGYWSDNVRSRWGRRHPFMYASIVPLGVTYALLWMPPGGVGQQALFWYLLVISILVRVFASIFETPSSAMLPELSYDYDERSTIQGYRLFFGHSGGNIMTVLMFAVVFPMFATASIPNGQFNREAYVTYGAIAAGLAMLAIIVCALGTHGRITYMHVAPPRARMTLRTVLGEMRHTLADPSFTALFVAAILGSIASGLYASLTFYFATFFWGLSSEQIGLITLGVFLSAFLGAVIAPTASRRWGKKRGAMIIGLIAFVGAPLPVLLRLAGLLPGNDDPSIFWIVLATNTVDTALIIAFQILTSAMVADLVEQAELRTGRRSEGVFFAAITFIRKTVLGLGLIAASLILTLAAFPEGAKPGEVAADTLWRLGAFYVPTILALWLTMMAVISRYRLSRDDHEDNLRKLAEARASFEPPLATIK